MRREGRQHGMVVPREIYSEISKPRSRIVNKLQTVPTTKYMTRVSSKPTNHSRFTGRWSHGCTCPMCNDHTWPINKSRAKAKGTHKLRHRADVEVNHLLVSHRLVGSANRAHWVRFDYGSANWILSQLMNDDYGDLDIDYHDHEFDDGYDMHWDDHDDVEGGQENGLICQKEEAEVDMGFCFVEFVRELDLDGEEDWCLIGEI